MPAHTEPNTRQFEELLEELRGSAAAIGLGVAAAAESSRASARQGDWGDGFALLDASLRILFVNPVASQILGRSAAQLGGASFLGEHPARVRQALEFHLLRVLAGGSNFRYESFSQPLGGWCEIHAWPVAGSMVAIQFRDSADSRTSRDRLEFLSNATDVLAASLDTTTTLKTVARLAVPTLGDYCLFDVVDEEGKIQRVAWEHADPISRRQFDEVFASTSSEYFDNHPVSRLVATGEPDFEPELTDDILKARSTGPRHFELVRRFGPRSLVAVPVIARGKTLGALTFAFTDLSGRRHTHADLDLATELARRAALALDNAMLYSRAHRQHAEALQAEVERDRAMQAARGSEDQFQFIAGFIPDMLWLAGPDGSCEYAGGDRLAEYTGSSQESLKAGAWVDALHPEDRSLYVDLWDRSRLTAEPFETECRLRRADGEYRSFLVRARAMRDPGGRVVKWFGSLTDIENHKRAEEARRHTQKLESIGLLAGGIAHDFNNLLTGIMMGAGHALDGLPAESPARPVLKSVIRTGERAADLTRQLLAYSGKGRFVTRRVDLGALTREMAGLLHSSISRKAEIVLEMDSELPAVHGDPAQMQQLVMNLVINAAEALGEAGGVVTVSAGTEIVAQPRAPRGCPGETIPPGEYVWLRVRDRGCGMDAGTLARIFDPFFTTKFAGRGLGLAATLGIVRGHRGLLDVGSEPGKGSEFRVMLPVAAGPGEPAAPAEAAREAAPGTGTILVVDDEEMVRCMASAALGHYGYASLEACNGREALEVFGARSSEICAIVLDVAMPQAGGIEILDTLRAIRPDVPVVLSSGFSDMEAAGLDLSGPGLKFLPKPYTPAQLVAAIQSALPAPSA